MKWAFLAVIWGYTALFGVLSYFVLRWVKYERPGDKYSSPLPSALEKPPTELKDLTYGVLPFFFLLPSFFSNSYFRIFSDAYEKRRKLSNAFMMFRKKVKKNILTSARSLLIHEFKKKLFTNRERGRKLKAHISHSVM